jgi:hypothetical protein
MVSGQPGVRISGQTISDANQTIMSTVPNMKAYLSGLAGKGYTAARLHAMTRNDLVFACKTELGLR